MGNYIPVSEQEKEQMLEQLGIKEERELFLDVPKEVMLEPGEIRLPKGKSEMEVQRYMKEIAAMNKVFPVILRGAGAYRHYIPAIVPYVVGKEEFLTSYTPYQAEISQGVLQSIFEYQTMICELTGMDVSNASIYDGASAAAEAVAMTRQRKRQKALVSMTSHPDTIATIKTYCYGADSPIEFIPEVDGITDIKDIEKMMDDQTACIYLQYPNFFGYFEDIEKIVEIAHERGVKVILACNPIALAICKTPGEMNVDIVVGEGQPLGLPLSYGGPYLGFLAAKQEFIRKLPGRIVGETTDINGKRAFVLTLQAREQHIRREKASSNICTNQALCAMTASVYMATMGPEGLKEVATQCFQKAHYYQQKLEESCGLNIVARGKEFFHEFVTDAGGKQKDILSALEKEGILGGLPLKNDKILWCVTEVVTKNQLDKAIKTIREVLER